MAGAADVLHDDVDRDARVGQWLEYGRRDAGAVAHPDHGYLRDVGFLRDTAHTLAIFHRYVSDDHRTDAVVEARPNVDRDAVELGDLDRARMHDACANRRELEHLVVLDVSQLLRRLHDPRVRGEDAVDIGVDLTRLRAQRRGECHRGGVRAAASQGRDVELSCHALKTGDDWNLVLAQGLDDAVGFDVLDAGSRVLPAGAYTGLRAGE